MKWHARVARLQLGFAFSLVYKAERGAARPSAAANGPKRNDVSPIVIIALLEIIGEARRRNIAEERETSKYGESVMAEAGAYV